MRKLIYKTLNSEKKTNTELLTVLIIMIILLVSTEYVSANTKIVKVIYYYNNVCESCREADEVIDNYHSTLKKAAKKYGYTIEFPTYNTYETAFLTDFISMCTLYEIPEDDRKVPILFFGDGYYQGAEDIETGLKEIEKAMLSHSIPDTKTAKNLEGSGELKKEFLKMNYVSTALAGLVNGLNPCSLSMLLFLISLLLAKESINILKPGLFFIAGKFISYLLIGTVLFSVMSSINMSTYEIIVKLFMGTFIIIVAGLNIFDYFALKKEKYGDVKNQLPSGLRKWNHKVIEKFNNKTGMMSMSIGAFFLGFIVSVGEFLCTGQVYVATIVYMLKNEQALSLKAFSYLITYSLAFIIPILIIIFILYKTRNIMNVSEKIRKNMPVIKLLTAFILIILGIVVVFFL